MTMFVRGKVPAGFKHQEWTEDIRADDPLSARECASDAVTARTQFRRWGTSDIILDD